MEILDANTMVGLHPNHKLDLSVERLVGKMDKYSIAASLVISTMAVFHHSETGNEITLESAGENNRLIPIGTVNPRTYFGNPDDLQAIKSKGFRIFKFFPIEQGWGINSAAFGEVLRQLSPTKTPIMVDAGCPGCPSAFASMASSYGAPVILSSVSVETLSEALAVMAGAPNVFIETHELHVPGGLEMIASKVGADRIVFGSGAPMRSTASSLYYVMDSDLPEADKQRVFSGNLKRILEAG